MKLIDANFAIKKLREQKEEFTVDSIIAFLESIAVEAEAISWYKVDDPPKKSGVYLVTLNDAYVDFCCYYPNEKSFGWADNLCDEVTAWAYLPHPYKEEEEI